MFPTATAPGAKLERGLFYGGKEERGKESVDSPLCILLKGKENDSSCKCSALQLGYPEGAGLGSAHRVALVLGWNGLTHPQNIPEFTLQLG